MQQFYQENIASFHEAQLTELWKAYGSRYYRMDAHYRAFHLAFGRSLKNSSTVLEDLYKGVAEYVEKLYKNWFLQEIGKKWTSLISEEISGGTALQGILQQSGFYSHFVKPVVSSGSRVFVIISDALRYEVGADLAEQLVRETRGTAKISSVQSVYPSATKYGMAALLPHEKITLSGQKLDVFCDLMPTAKTEERGAVLKKYCDGNVAVTYRDLIAMKQAQRREMISQAQVVYIYHNVIDAVGEKLITEDQVFEACNSAITEIKNLVRVIANDLSGTNILITADHGFLYSYQPLEEIDKAEKKYISGNILELDRRYVIADSNCTAEHMLEVPLTLYGSAYKSFTPMDYIRLKAPSGMNYVHGGISLQECMIPVIEYKNMRASAKNFVDVKKAELQLVSQSRKVSNSIFSLDFYQKEPVGGKITGAEYDISMYDAAGNAVSDHQTIIADKTGTNGSDRMFRVRLTLKNKEFKKTDTYYLKVCDKEKSEISDSIEFTIDIAFTNDFDF